ncbi:IQ motif, EF-hand binding site [Dillenia turbinata]|uniref:IQ motif, EF-hand binding site n=1 Tax=Dillenia turbinata TaxID=194707 RepID=A0AAN8Z7Y9_9MAGN
MIFQNLMIIFQTAKLVSLESKAKNHFPRQHGEHQRKLGVKKRLIAAKSHSGGLHEDPLTDLNLEIHSTNGNGENVLLERETSANLPLDAIISLPEITRQEQGAAKLQAAFRGYFARRPFKALKGIIRLQALVCGHLVRRQAVATLISVRGIVKLQVVIRGRRAKFSDPRHKVQKILDSK